jgi:hypothetical protein
MVGKARVTQRLKTVVGSKSHNRNEELNLLTEKYNEFNKNLKAFIVVLKQHYSAMETISKSRLEVC